MSDKKHKRRKSMISEYDFPALNKSNANSRIRIKKSKLAQLLIDGRKFEEALEILLPAADLFPDSEIICGQICKCYYEMRQFEKFELFARRGWGISEDAYSRGYLVRALTMNKKLSEAEVLAREGIQNDISINSIHYNDLIMILTLEKKYAEAERFARESVEFFHDFPSYRLLSKILLINGKLEESERCARQALKIEKNSKTYNQLGIVLLMQNKLLKAEGVFKEALGLGDNGQTFYLFAETLRKQGRYIEALDFIEEKKMCDKMALLCQAYCLMPQGRYDECLAVLIRSESAADDIIHYFEVDFRLMNGYVFLYDRIVNAGAKVPTQLWAKLKIAVDWLKKNKDTPRGIGQEFDYVSAMEIIKKYKF